MGLGTRPVYKNNDEKKNNLCQFLHTFWKIHLDTFFCFVGRYLTELCQGDMLSANPTLGIASHSESFA